MPKYVVRYGSMRHLGVMSARVDMLRRGEKVVVRTQRGVEIGDVLCQATDDSLTHLDEAPQGQILRLLSDEDSAEAGRIEERRNEVFQACRTRIAESGLEMKLIDVEQMLGGDRIVVYYLSEDRVDFRDLVKMLSGDLRTRIEMRQVGVRDEAKLLADYGDCGKPVCCNTHLSQMPPVSMKMAKLQKATLDPNKISGRCGRLKCCLRYEYDTYEAIVKELPPIGSEIVTRDGKGRVLGQEILAEQLLIETEDHRRRTIHSSEVLTVVKRGSNRPSRGGGGNRGRDADRDADRDSDSAELAESNAASDAPVSSPSRTGERPRNEQRNEQRPRPQRESLPPRTPGPRSNESQLPTETSNEAPTEPPTAAVVTPSIPPRDPSGDSSASPSHTTTSPASTLIPETGEDESYEVSDDVAQEDEEFDEESSETEGEMEGEGSGQRTRRGGRRRRGRRRRQSDEGPTDAGPADERPADERPADERPVNGSGPSEATESPKAPPPEPTSEN